MYMWGRLVACGGLAGRLLGTWNTLTPTRVS
jgi:hypothetical protein